MLFRKCLINRTEVVRFKQNKVVILVYVELTIDIIDDVIVICCFAVILGLYITNNIDDIQHKTQNIGSFQKAFLLRKFWLKHKNYNICFYSKVVV